MTTTTLTPLSRLHKRGRGVSERRLAAIQVCVTNSETPSSQLKVKSPAKSAIRHGVAAALGVKLSGSRPTQEYANTYGLTSFEADLVRRANATDKPLTEVLREVVDRDGNSVDPLVDAWGRIFDPRGAKPGLEPVQTELTPSAGSPIHLSEVLNRPERDAMRMIVRGRIRAIEACAAATTAIPTVDLGWIAPAARGPIRHGVARTTGIPIEGPEPSREDSNRFGLTTFEIHLVAAAHTQHRSVERTLELVLLDPLVDRSGRLCDPRDTKLRGRWPLPQRRDAEAAVFDGPPLGVSDEVRAQIMDRHAAEASAAEQSRAAAREQAATAMLDEVEGLVLKADRANRRIQDLERRAKAALKRAEVMEQAATQSAERAAAAAKRAEEAAIEVENRSVEADLLDFDEPFAKLARVWSRELDELPLAPDPRRRTPRRTTDPVPKDVVEALEVVVAWSREADVHVVVQSGRAVLLDPVEVPLLPGRLVDLRKRSEPSESVPADGSWSEFRWGATPRGRSGWEIEVTHGHQTRVFRWDSSDLRWIDREGLVLGFGSPIHFRLRGLR